MQILDIYLYLNAFIHTYVYMFSPYIIYFVLHNQEKGVDSD